MSDYPKCSVCSGEWHGLLTAYGCPGEYGSDEEKREWLAYAAQYGLFAMTQ